MSTDDQVRWNTRYRSAPPPKPCCPELFAPHKDLFPEAGEAVDVACGTGSASLWLAHRGLTVLGLDVSPIAIDAARAAADRLGLANGCRFESVDLDDGLPPGAPVDLIVCHRFRQPSLYRPMVERLKPGGLLAIAVLSEVEAEPGQFRAPAGELTEAFADFEIIVSYEGSGSAVLIARKR